MHAHVLIHANCCSLVVVCWCSSSVFPFSRFLYRSDRCFPYLNSFKLVMFGPFSACCLVWDMASCERPYFLYIVKWMKSSLIGTGTTSSYLLWHLNYYSKLSKLFTLTSLYKILETKEGIFDIVLTYKFKVKRQKYQTPGEIFKSSNT